MGRIVVEVEKVLLLLLDGKWSWTIIGFWMGFGSGICPGPFGNNVSDCNDCARVWFAVGVTLGDLLK